MNYSWNLPGFALYQRNSQIITTVVENHFSIGPIPGGWSKQPHEMSATGEVCFLGLALENGELLTE